MPVARTFPDVRTEVIECLYDELSPAENRLTLFPEEPRYGLKIDYDDEKHFYKVNGEDVPSVTAIGEATRPKAALQWWSFRVGLAAAVKLISEGALSYGALSSWEHEPIVKPGEFTDHPQVKLRSGKAKHEMEILSLERRWSPNHIKDDKGTRGTSIHNAAEKLGLTGLVPSIEEFPEDDRGYIQALAKWWLDADVDVKQMEVIVGSERFGFAGRFDLVAERQDGQRWLLDYKTSGGIYPEYDLQLSLYHLAYHDMGLHHHPDFGPLDGAFCVHLRPDGTYEQVPMSISHADALTELLVFHQRRDQAQRVKALGRRA